MPDTSPDRMPPDDLLTRPVAHTFKNDARTTVWRCDDDAGSAWVVKRFNAPRWAQAWRRALRCHPADRERRWDRQLSGNRVPVVRIAGGGVDAAGRSWLVTPDAGASLHRLLSDGALRDARLRQRLAREAGAVTGAVLASRAFNRDHRAPNLVAGDASREPMRLIDYGGCRSARGAPLLAAALPMLTQLDASVARAAGLADDPVPVSRTDRLRFFRALIAAWPGPPDGLQHLPRHPEFSM